MKALVTCEATADGLDRLRSLGYDVEHDGWGATRRALGHDAYVDAAEGAVLLLTEIEAVDADVLDACPELAVVGTARGTPVNVDLAACTARGVPVLHAPGRNAASVADFTVGMLLALVRRVAAADRQLRSGTWLVDGELPYLHHRGPELSRLTVGLVGHGAVGREVDRRLHHGFGATVQWHDPAVDGSIPLERLLATSDVVSLHCPRGPATDRLLRRETLALMPRGSWVVNTAGGSCVDEDDLVDALERGHLAGAALDVFATEPLPPSSRLVGREDVLLTPHLAGAADDVVRHHTAMLVGDVERLARGERPVRCANPEVLAGG